MLFPLTSLVVLGDQNRSSTEWLLCWVWLQKKVAEEKLSQETLEELAQGKSMREEKCLQSAP